MNRAQPALKGELIAAEALAKLAIARGGLLDEYSADVYLDRLQRFDVKLVARACEALSDEPRREYETSLPDVGRIIERIHVCEREDAERLAESRLLPAPKRDDNEPRFHCLACLDEPSGWRSFWCPGTGQFRSHEKPERATRLTMHPCARPKDHGQHPYVDYCECRETNPVIHQHRQRMAAAQQRKSAHR